MEWISQFVSPINSFVWGPAMLILILGSGLYLMLGLRLMPLLKLNQSFKLLRTKNRGEDCDGDIPPFQALMTAMSATVGTGNIAGVATAIVLGGPGALFWMWCTALVGMATKYTEAVLAVHYREVDAKGDHIGGPMYYIKNGLGEKWHWLGTLFAIFGALAAFGIGNTVQANSVADVLQSNFKIDPLWCGIGLAILVGLVIIGGIRRIGHVAGTLVPLMAFSYVTAGVIALGLNIEQLPEALNLVLSHAFTDTAAEGGFAGATVWAAIRFGVARGIFSNEAGLGSAPIAHASAKTQQPVQQGLIAMLGTFIDTLIICTITGLVIISTGSWTSGESGAALTSSAFQSVYNQNGGALVAIALAIFALTTLIGWSYYGEKCVEYLFGLKAITLYRLLWVVAIPIGATTGLDLIWLIADTLNALMAVPNLIALLLLSPVVFKLSKKYFQKP